MRPPVTPAKRREILTAFAKLKGLLFPWCCVCSKVMGPPKSSGGAEGGLSDSLHPACCKAFYGFVPKELVAA